MKGGNNRQWLASRPSCQTRAWILPLQSSERRRRDMRKDMASSQLEQQRVGVPR